MSDPRRPRWIQNPDGSIFDPDSCEALCGAHPWPGTRCTLPPNHHGGHRVQYLYPRDDSPKPSKVDEFLATSLDPVIDLDAGPKPSSLYPHDMDLPRNHAWRTHPDQLRYGSSRRMSVHTAAAAQRSELHYLIDQLFDYAEDTGKPIDLGTLKLEVQTDETLGHHITRISAVTKAPTAD